MQEQQKISKLEKIKDPGSAITHFIGFLAIIPCFVLLVLRAKQEASTVAMVGFVIFGISLLLLYAASTIYHTVRVSPEHTQLLRRIDHMMIFVLIAGTYTPICLISLRGVWGWTLLACIWGIALCGIILKIIWLQAPRWLSTIIYIVMGWLAVVAFVPLERAVSWRGIGMLLAGGIAYTVGAIIYALKKPNIGHCKYFGFHEIFHVFVMAGTACHIIFMFVFVV